MRLTVAASRTIAAVLFSLVACARSRGAPLAPPSVEPPIAWGPAPAVFPAGAQMAVLQGDPSKAEPFTVRLRFPDGYRIAPHTHPTDEHVTVIAGTFVVGMGATVRLDEMTAVPAGGFVTAPAGHAHYAAARGTTVVQVNAVGPFALAYVRSADLPIGARLPTRLAEARP